MTLLYDANGLVVGDDGTPDVGWDSNALDPAVGIPPAQIAQSDVGYFQQKINEFQDVLYAVDATSNELDSMLQQSLTEQEAADIQSLQDEYASRKMAFKFAAESFNAVSAAVDAVGGNLTPLNIPSGLGFAPVAVPIGWGLAIAGAAVLISFGIGWMARAKTAVDTASARLRADAANTTDPTEMKRLLIAADNADIASAGIAVQQQAAGGTIGQIAGAVKWIAIAAGAYLIFKLMYEKGGK